ncbi:NADH dehydrogenase [ubiquinone] 1 subunit C2 [Colletes gigas]|uniref:NADH dehydrogenase [ubiquinone] 1 subunit C2 n=1 Tax=Colletes gigas TaxID=935657 RepID=UPI001C9B0029|nr:NADH dehydrogenase [ubiquinone] 1 subunit C2 [Colletes gigas]XP_043259579.1 NADH dehydrogenase [ubiquinone] 1 subunit C2 [Colletes gigas]XP_043259580.1 NADH dehydrogenase [ubiquinone] 1 subunit C2 [Colletes gigas]
MGDGGKEPDGEWAIDLLTRDMGYKTQFYNTYFSEMLFGIAGFCAPLSANVWVRQPLFSHLPIAIVGGLIGVAIGNFVTKKVDFFFARRDAKLIDYIRLHPDRFPAPENKKYADIFQPWVPLR